MTNNKPAFGYYKVCHDAPKGERQEPRIFFYRYDVRDKTLALSAAMAIKKASQSMVVSNYDPSNKCHPNLMIV